jgi:hypothetical protein
MRMMLKAVVDTAAGNAVIADGSIGQVIGGLVDRLKPEAAYFAGEDGQRACFMVFDMDDAADLPSICEPLFNAMNARVTVTPCMNLDDLQKGLSRLNAARGAPAGDGTSRPSAAVG